MDDNEGKFIIFLWNLYVLFFYPLAIFSSTLWSIEISGNYPSVINRGVPIVVLASFFPEMVVGLKWNLNSKMFIIISSIVDGLILNRFLHYYLMGLTYAPNTYWILNSMLVLGLVWGIVIEYSQPLKEHILKYPESQWLFPHTEDEEQNEIWQFIWKILFYVSLGCMIMDKFGLVK